MKLLHQNMSEQKRVITSANNRELAEKIKLSSQKILKQRYNLYKSLENK